MSEFCNCTGPGHCAGQSPKVKCRIDNDQPFADTDLMEEARALIKFYDERGKNWESALGFTMCRDWLGNRLGVYDPKTHFLMPIRGRK